MANFFDLENSATPTTAQNFFDLGDTPKEETKTKEKSGYLSDAIKSFGAGIVKGAAPILSDVGTAAQIEMGQEPNVGTPEETQKAIEENVTGPLHKPETLPGQYSEKFGSFVPYVATSPGGFTGAASTVPAAARTAIIKLGTEALLPSAGAETGKILTSPGGQPTSATPWAEAAGAMLSPGMRSTMAAKPTPEHQALVNYLIGKGINPTAGDQAGMGFARWVEQNAPDMPFLGGLGQRINQKRDTEFTHELMRRAGATELDTTTRAMPDELKGLHDTLSKNYNDLAARNNLKYDGGLLDDLNSTAQKYIDATGKDVPPLVTKTMDRIVETKDKGIMSGTEYQNRRHELDQAANRALQTDPERGYALLQTRRALDSAWGRSISPQDQQLWQQTNQQWGNLKNLEASVSGPGQNIAEGLASPEKYRTAVEKWEGKSGYSRASDENSQLARASTVLNRLPQSGTGPRTTATILGALGGSALLGGTTGLGVGSGAMLGPSLLGGLMLHPPGQALMKPLGTSTPGYLTPYLIRSLLNQQAPQ